MLNTMFLWYLVQINKYNSLSTAAEHMHLTQPALSSAIKSLEDQLHTKLLNRSYKGITLTEEGMQVVKKAEKYLNCWMKWNICFSNQKNMKTLFFWTIIQFTVTPHIHLY